MEPFNQKWQIPSFAHCRVVSNMYDLFSFVETKGRHFSCPSCSFAHNGNSTERCYVHTLYIYLHQPMTFDFVDAKLGTTS